MTTEADGDNITCKVCTHPVTTIYKTRIQDLLSQDHGKTMKLKIKMWLFQAQGEDYEVQDRESEVARPRLLKVGLQKCLNRVSSHL